MLTDCEKLGIDFCVHTSYVAVDLAKELSDEQKRSLLFSLYSFRCLFDKAEMLKINPILKKYACSFTLKLNQHPEYLAHKDEFDSLDASESPYIPYGGLCIKGDNGDPLLKFDAGSELHSRLVGGGKITGASASTPKKHSLFKMVRLILQLSSASVELKSAWYLVFPYIVLIGAPFEDEEYNMIVDSLFCLDIFQSAIALPFSINAPDSVEELRAQGYPAIITEFLTPYIEFKNFKDEKGISREVERFHAWLARGMFDIVLEGSEKLLDTFPDDDELLLVNLAARVSLNTALSDEDKTALLYDTLNVINARLETPCEKIHFLLYYCGITLLGLRRLDEAIDKFHEALDHAPGFVPAKQLLEKLKV